MTTNTTTRNLQDGSLVIKDGASTPLECAVICDEGDLSWTVTREYVDDYCRKVLTSRRENRDVPCEVSFTFKWSNLIAYTVNSSDGITPYEILTNYGDSFTSTRVSNDHYAVDLEFTVDSSDGVSGNDEIITFEDVALLTCTASEGEEGNTVAVSGQMMGTEPVITRGS